MRSGLRAVQTEGRVVYLHEWKSNSLGSSVTRRRVATCLTIGVGLAAGTSAILSLPGVKWLEPEGDNY
jgi:hypothetical protein